MAAGGEEDFECKFEDLSDQNAYKKYFTLKRRCEMVQQTNEKLINRIFHVKKMIKRYKKERRFLMTRLDECGDNYRDIQVPVMWEESQMYNLFAPPPPYPQGSTATPAGEATSATGLLTVDPSTTTPAVPVPSHPPPPYPQSTTSNPYLARMNSSEGKFGSPGSEGKGRRVVKQEQKPLTSAYLLFCQLQGPSIQEEYFMEHEEEIIHPELTKRLAQKWNNLSAEDKKIYFDRYDLEKAKIALMAKDKSSSVENLLNIKVETETG